MTTSLIGRLLRPLRAGIGKTAWFHPATTMAPQTITVTSPAFADGAAIPSSMRGPASATTSRRRCNGAEFPTMPSNSSWSSKILTSHYRGPTCTELHLASLRGPTRSDKAHCNDMRGRARFAVTAHADTSSNSLHSTLKADSTKRRISARPSLRLKVALSPAAG
jgi:hypothetical protein